MGQLTNYIFLYISIWQCVIAMLNYRRVTHDQEVLAYVSIFNGWFQSHFSVIVTVMLSTSSFLRANNILYYCTRCLPFPYDEATNVYVYFSLNQALIRDKRYMFTLTQLPK